MRLLVGMKVWRQSEYITYCLKAVYGVADYIRIAHGPVRVVADAGFTNDDTVEKIRNFPDPEKKITLIDKPIWNDITEMCNATIDLRANFYLKLDGDEIPTLRWLKEFYSLMPESMKKRLPITSNYHHFWGDFKHVYAHVSKHDKMYEYRLRGFYLHGGLRFKHPDFVEGIWEFFNGPSLPMEHRLHHFHRVRKLDNMIACLYYQNAAWGKWTTTHLKTPHSGGDNLSHDWLRPDVEEYTGQIPECLITHPYFATGITDDLMAIHWEELLNVNQSDP